MISRNVSKVRPEPMPLMSIFTRPASYSESKTVSFAPEVEGNTILQPKTIDSNSHNIIVNKIDENIYDIVCEKKKSGKFKEKGPTSKNWCFTNFDFKDTSWYELKDNLKFIGYGEEICPTTKKLHHQGFIQLKLKKTLGWLKNNFSSKTNFTIMRGTYEENLKYCSKEGKYLENGEFTKQGQRTDIDDIATRIKEGTFSKSEGIYLKYHAGIDKMIEFTKNEKARKCAKREFDTDISELNLQQKFWMHLLDNVVSKDQILVILDKKGGIGKSTFATYLDLELGGLCLQNAKSTDIAHAYKMEDYVMFDYARSNEDKLNYPVLENLKNGCIFSPKYDSGSKRFPRPKIILFTNFQLAWKEMSERKWFIVKYINGIINAIKDGEEEWFAADDNYINELLSEVPIESKEINHASKQDIDNACIIDNHTDDETNVKIYNNSDDDSSDISDDSSDSDHIDRKKIVKNNKIRYKYL